MGFRTFHAEQQRSKYCQYV